jgi:hypothetical protein
MNFLRFVFSSFWAWAGFTLLVLIPFQFFLTIISRLIRRSMVIKKGWPPEHLDADGDWKEKKERAN